MKGELKHINHTSLQNPHLLPKVVESVSAHSWLLAFGMFPVTNAKSIEQTICNFLRTRMNFCAPENYSKLYAVLRKGLVLQIQA